MKAILKDGNGTSILNAISDKDNIKMVILDNFEEFNKIFKPIQNPLSECFYFETYGQEYDIVLANHKENPNSVWTVVNEDGMYVKLGMWICDRVHYIITKEPAHWPVRDFRYCGNDEEVA